MKTRVASCLLVLGVCGSVEAAEGSGSGQALTLFACQGHAVSINGSRTLVLGLTLRLAGERRSDS
jgi:hypothetical protein